MDTKLSELRCSRAGKLAALEADYQEKLRPFKEAVSKAQKELHAARVRLWPAYNRTRAVIYNEAEETFKGLKD